MFIGHYSASFIAKAIAPAVPLWLLLVAAQLVDIVWGLLVLGGVELATLDAALPSNPLVLQYMPYSHSLVATIVWSLIAFVVANKAFRFAARESMVVMVVVASHWFFDLLVHRPDLPLLANCAEARAWAVELSAARLWPRDITAAVRRLVLRAGDAGSLGSPAFLVWVRAGLGRYSNDDVVWPDAFNAHGDGGVGVVAVLCCSLRRPLGRAPSSSCELLISRVYARIQ